MPQGSLTKIKAIDLSQMASAADLVFGALRSAITRGELAEGEVLRQHQIAQLFNVSRIPVREALARLEEQGLVRAERYRGAVVTGLSIQEIEELFEFRALLEPELIRHSVRTLTPEALDKAARFSEAFATEADPSLWSELNRKFHFTLYEGANRPYFQQVVDTALIRIERYLRAQLLLTNGMERARTEHQAILVACQRRNADEAARLTREHILGAGESLIAFIAQSRAEGRAPPF